MELWIIEGDNPVHDFFFLPSSILSSAGHVKPCMNLPGPSGKAKYSQETDSEPVPWGKGEKHLKSRSEIDPETMCLQAVGASFLVWRRAFCIMNLRVIFTGKVKCLKHVSRSESES